MFAHILVVIIVAIAISGFAERRNAQPALVVAVLGLAASFIPGVPALELEPDIILGIVLPPMLFSAASDFSFGSFIKRLGSIINLGVLMVFATAIAVAAVAGFSVPGLTPMAALVLGAVLAPPDAVTAITIGRKAGLPGGLMTVLKGESLINDAAALTLFAVAVAATTGTHAFIDNLLLYFLYAATVGVITGLVMGQIAAFARRKLGNPSLATAVSVILPFAAYLVAEELHASGVLAVVAAGFAIGHSSAESGYEERIQERQFWRTVDTLLETFVFAYIGLQLRFVITDADEAGYDLGQLLFAAGAIFLATTAIRFAWVFGTALIARWRTRAVLKRFDQRTPPPGRRPPHQPATPLTWKENTVLAWTGMRGVVTLAAAAGVPTLVASGAAFPGREAILTIAFLVTIATLLIQGSTLPWMIRALDLSGEEDQSHAQEQHHLARAIAQQAMLDALDEYRRENPSPAAQRMAELMAQRNFRFEKAAEEGANLDREAIADLSSRLLSARRSKLIAARDARELDDEVMREMLERMDLEQAFMQARGSKH